MSRWYFTYSVLLIVVSLIFWGCSKDGPCDSPFREYVINVSPEGAGTVEKKTIDDGERLELIAIPANGYSFSYWGGINYYGGDIHSTENPFYNWAICMPDDSQTKITAYFEKIEE